MSLLRLILRELAHRKVNTLLALMSIVAAAACLTAGITLLRGHDVQTDRLLAAAALETEARTRELTDDYRKIALKQGFNVFIIPARSGATDAGAAPAEMPFDHVHKLAGAGIITIEHLLPSLSVPMFWQEQKLAVTLTGIAGEVPIAGTPGQPRRAKKPLMQPVKPGQIVLGYEAARSTGLKPGDEVQLLGEMFKVSHAHGARGTNDDLTIWIDLATAQRLLGKEGRITAIQAINCLAPDCYPDETGIPSVSQEIARVLPDTQVVIDMAKARARIDNRVRAMQEAKAAMAAEASRRAMMRGQIESFSSVLAPVAIAGCGVWIGMLALTNARERRGEVGILRALGVTTGFIVALFLGKAVMIGLAGAAGGYALGMAVALAYGETGAGEVFHAGVPLFLTAGAPLLAAVASWLPSMLAAQQDPAAVLGQE